MNSLNIQTPKGENGAQTTYTFPKLEKKLENTLRRMELHFSFEIGPPVCKSTVQKQKNIWKCISRFHVIFKSTFLGREMRNALKHFPVLKNANLIYLIDLKRRSIVINYRPASLL